MARGRKESIGRSNGEQYLKHHSDFKIGSCCTCGKRFRARSHFDLICNMCWADNEMKPYTAIKRKDYAAAS